MENSLELTILMPCLNEAETLKTCISKAQTFIKKNNVQAEILIADNGSTDGSQAIAHENGARVINVATKGYGSAILAGIKAAYGKYLIVGDADDSYDFLNLEPFIKELRKGYDLVMGNRFKGKISQGAMPFLHKYLGNPVLSFLGRIFFKSSLGDFHCGLRGFNREKILELKLSTPGMEFASEMIVKSLLNQLRIKEIPTTLKKDGRSRPPHLNTWRDGWRHLRFLLLFSPKWLYFMPGLLLILFGMTTYSLLAFSSFKIGHIKFDIHTLLIGAICIIASNNFINPQN